LTQPTIGFKAIMREGADTRSYAAALSVLVVAEWLYLDWASRAPQPLPNNFVHAEWITLHDNPNFRGFVDFLRTELDRVGAGKRCTEQNQETVEKAVVLNEIARHHRIRLPPAASPGRRSSTQKPPVGNVRSATSAKGW
jgi:thiaminase